LPANTHRHISIGAAREALVHTGAKGCFAFLTIATTTIRDIERQHYAITLLQQCHTASNLFHYAHILVAED
jgi:hypothetical protein